MCLIAFAVGVSDQWPLVIASNRDEFLSRPTLPLDQWKTDSGHRIISGRDSQAGGTWLGITPEGRVAFLTNVREEKSESAWLSRGDLVMRWLAGSDDFTNFAASLEENKTRYAGFNLVVGNLQQNFWAWLTNRSALSAVSWQLKILKPGVYGLSNAALDTSWPKTVAMKKILAAALQQENTGIGLGALKKSLWDALARREKMLPACLPIPGISEQMQMALSSIFVDFPERRYGTRSSTLLVASRSQKTLDTLKIPSLHIDMAERSYVRSTLDCHPLPFQNVDFSFNLI